MKKILPVLVLGAMLLPSFSYAQTAQVSTQVDTQVTLQDALKQLITLLTAKLVILQKQLSDQIAAQSSQLTQIQNTQVAQGQQIQAIANQVATAAVPTPTPVVFYVTPSPTATPTPKVTPTPRPTPTPVLFSCSGGGYGYNVCNNYSALPIVITKIFYGAQGGMNSLFRIKAISGFGNTEIDNISTSTSTLNSLSGLYQPIVLDTNIRIEPNDKVTFQYLCSIDGVSFPSNSVRMESDVASANGSCSINPSSDDVSAFQWSFIQ